MPLPCRFFTILVGAHAATMAADQLEWEGDADTMTIDSKGWLFARIARFEAVMDLMGRGATTSWTKAANHFGYFDQMHMVHEFAEFTGETPTRTLSVLKSYFRDVLAALQSDQDPEHALRKTRLVI